MTDLTPRGPFRAPDDVQRAAAVLRDAVRALEPDDRVSERARHILDTLTACGVQFGAEDERTARWAAATLDQPEVAILLDWVLRAREAAAVPAMTWVLYQAGSGTGILSPAGIDGRQGTARNAVALAVAKLTESTTEHPSWVVKVFGPDDRLLAYAQWEHGHAVGYLAQQEPPPAARHALSPLYGRVSRVEAEPRCGAPDGQVVLMASDVDCPDCRALMEAQDQQ